MPGDCPRCKCRTATGRRCRNNTCKFLPCCWLHTQQDRVPIVDAQLRQGLYVQRSTIPGAGCGLFTSNAIRKGQKIGLYTGRQVARRRDDPRAHHYDMQCARSRTTLDATNRHAIRNSALRYANRGTRAKPNNARIGTTIRSGRIQGCNIRASRNIPAHGEILLAYGAGYRMPPPGGPGSRNCRYRRYH